MLVATLNPEPEESNEPTMAQIHEAISNALKDLGLNHLRSEGGIYYVESTYVYDSMGKQWVINLRED